MTKPYAGDVSPADSWAALESDPAAVLVDVRTRAEWNYVGLPDPAPLGKTLVRVEWQSWPDGQVNKDFVAQIKASGVTPDQPVYLLCRSGARSRSAAQLLTEHGWSRAYNVADGFEGPHDELKRRGCVSGWKRSGLPWSQG